MKSNLFMKRKLEIGLSLLIGTSVFGGCNNDLAPIRQSQTFPPNLNAPTVFESFSPDSGGVKTQLIIRGQNFGTDTAYLKVTVNNKRAAIVGVADDVIYAIVPARADTGYVRLFVGKDDNVEEYASQTKFIYQFKRNVTTLMGRQGQSGRDDGPYAECKLQRPWFALADKDGALFFIDEGRGQNKNGALRRAQEGWVETLVQNSSGPFQSPNLESIATDFLKRNYPKALLQPMAIDPSELAKSMGLTVKLKRITEDCSIFGQIFFEDSTAEIYDEKLCQSVEEEVSAKTILVDPETYFLYNLGKVNNTIVHECVHWDLHRKAFELERLYNNEASRIKCQVAGGVEGNSWTATEWMEWQANALAPRIQMPMGMFKTQASKYIKEYRDMLGKDDIIDVIEPVIDELAAFFCVSRLAAKIRMVDAGYEEAIGAFIYVDGRYVTPHKFRKNAIREDQTYTISAEEATIQSVINREFGELVRTGVYQYVDAHFVLNHPRYLEQRADGLVYLTDYARNHIDECCIPFDMTVKSTDKKDYYSVCYLNKDKDSTVSFDIKYSDGYQNSTDAAKKAKLVEEIVMEEMAIFQDLPNDYERSMKKVWDWKHEKEGLTYKELAERIHMDDQTISRLINNKRDPSINSLVLICLGMHLPPEISMHLIDKSPVALNYNKNDHIWYKFALTHLSKQSMISIENFFQEHNVQI